MRFSSNYCLVELDKHDYCSVELNDKGDKNLLKYIVPHIGLAMYEIKIESIDQHLELRCPSTQNWSSKYAVHVNDV
jgi:hypothetical protein